MNNKDLQNIYRYSYEYLLSILPKGLPESRLQIFFQGDSSGFTSVEDIYDRFIHSAQNYNMKSNVINYSDRKNRIKEILCGLDVSKIKCMDIDELVQTFRNEFDITREDSPNNIWRTWSESVIDAAIFLSDFKNANDFRNYVESHSKNIKARIMLAFIISNKISGMGFAVVCDCLKELGFFDYSKPDVHIIEVLKELGLLKNEEDILTEVLGENFADEFYNKRIRSKVKNKRNREAMASFIVVNNIAEACMEIEPTITPYKVDKVIWLCCSRNFRYLCKDVCVISDRDAKKEYIRALKANINANTYHV
jgi:hypothetical protein